MGLDTYLTAESTCVDFKELLNFTKPKSWLKSVSAFANTRGGTIVVGVGDKKELIGISDIRTMTAKAAEMINAHIEPSPGYELLPLREDNKDYLLIQVAEGPATPYYLVSSGFRTAYIRSGDESIAAPPHMLNSLILKGQNMTFDALPSPYKLSDVSFTYLVATFKSIQADFSLEERDLYSFGLLLSDNRLTYAGALLCDQYVVSQSRIFCTRWKNLTKGTVGEDAVDDKEYEGNILLLLENAEQFIKNNSKKSWAVSGMIREEHEDYPQSSVREALINAIIHRDYQIVGSEIHIDMYPDRVEIISPGGMIDGSRIQSLDISGVPSMRRNRIISDVFSRLHIMERRGSGLQRILDGYHDSPEKPVFFSESSFFRVVLPNKNYSKADVLNVPSVALSRSEEKIMGFISANPEVTADEIADMLDVSIRHARRLLAEMKGKNVIRRVGSDKAGKWEIVRDFSEQ